MKKILILPRFFELGGIHRAYATNSIAEEITHNGFLPVMPFYDTRAVTHAEGLEIARKMLDHFEVSGIILQGGNDISPSLYGQISSHAQGEQLYRDVVEAGIVLLAFEKNIPLFGICRGMQLINIVLGGTLHQHLHTDKWHQHIHSDGNRFEEKDMDSISHTIHDVLIEAGGVLSTLFFDISIEVNSYHHQGVDHVGTGIRVEAKSPDGLVEAISILEKKMLGLQWHPELDWSKGNFKKPFIWWLSQC